ncbi:4-diphosphocytidyl-2-C-methyl-D-erythritol kinase [Microbacterium halimionae]|uniref:4-diphosphocytidyl-2-C-methyl-D-erythritol kinase n=1 Tax=Microbacterium halimionae TaxID=1526413 RepID=A0A7W3JN30_9MICO|nr:4-(cytidine 5'-diphospho)-2-C-methyl-D-erythritol kinase [Microbacterium halimionae]MBA8815778.1 4-diphosphocytidyl-2-C-methyl-D-erythritol kinase [Microbacterium halimionae]NII95824.1 4-diphosphocytidyl-2-C-methyl-D-erythritol kinase [Microbacterium halimionae]
MSGATASTFQVHVRAPGKINVFFEVGAVESDGYHDVASAYQALSLYEDVWAEHSDGFSIEVAGSVDVAGVPLDESNLAVRAARLLASTTGYSGGVHLTIHKAVPVAGGMGGGSADAAGALVACDALWGTGLAMSELHELAAELGADVPFSLLGGTAIGTGRGDELSPALARGRFEWVLVSNSRGLSTPAVYQALDEYRAQRVLDISPAPRAPMVPPGVMQALRAGDPDMLALHVSNDLQVAALALRPDLAEILELGERSGALAGFVSGSGPTLAFLARDEASALDLQVTLSAAGCDALRAHGPVPGARVSTDPTPRR